MTKKMQSSIQQVKPLFHGGEKRCRRHLRHAMSTQIDEGPQCVEIIQYYILLCCIRVRARFRHATAMAAPRCAPLYAAITYSAPHSHSKATRRLCDIHIFTPAPPPARRSRMALYVAADDKCTFTTAPASRQWYVSILPFKMVAHDNAAMLPAPPTLVESWPLEFAAAVGLKMIYDYFARAALTAPRP